MAPMQDTSQVSTRLSGKSQGWKFIFVDPTFGGECPHVPTRKKRPSLTCSASPILETLPFEVQEMLLGNPPAGEESLPAAGSGKKAAEYLRRLSQDSKDASESGFGSDSDESALGKHDKKDKKSDSGSGFSDMTDDDKDEKSPKSPERQESSKSKASNASNKKSPRKQSEASNDSGFSAGSSKASAPKKKTGGGVSFGAEAEDKDAAAISAPVRANRRADTRLPDKVESTGESDDEDLLSNPFASSDEEEMGKQDSARSEKMMSKKDSARS